jgi:hypothetical protein
MTAAGAPAWSDGRDESRFVGHDDELRAVRAPSLERIRLVGLDRREAGAKAMGQGDDVLSLAEERDRRQHGTCARDTIRSPVRAADWT